MRRALLVVAVLFATACFQPDLSGPGAFACPDGKCPDNFTCQLRPTGRKICVRKSSSTSSDGSGASSEGGASDASSEGGTSDASSESDH